MQYVSVDRAASNEVIERTTIFECGKGNLVDVKHHGKDKAVILLRRQAPSRSRFSCYGVDNLDSAFRVKRYQRSGDFFWGIK